MNFKIYDSTVYSYGECLAPFTLIKEYNTFDDVNQFLSQSNPEIVYFISDEKNKKFFITSQEVIKYLNNKEITYNYWGDYHNKK
jgi:hypothetical protein